MMEVYNGLIIIGFIGFIIGESHGRIFKFNGKEELIIAQDSKGWYLPFPGLFGGKEGRWIIILFWKVRSFGRPGPGLYWGIYWLRAIIGVINHWLQGETYFLRLRRGIWKFFKIGFILGTLLV